MDISSYKKGAVLVISISGHIRAEDNGELETALRDEKLRQSNMVVLDISSLDYLNSRAIGSVMALWMELASSGSKIRVIQPKPLVERLLKSVGMYTLVPTSLTVDNAVDELAKGK